MAGVGVSSQVSPPLGAMSATTGGVGIDPYVTTSSGRREGSEWVVTLEALASGTPALGTPVGATPELLKPLAPQLVLAGGPAHSHPGRAFGVHGDGSGETIDPAAVVGLTV